MAASILTLLLLLVPSCWAGERLSPHGVKSTPKPLCLLSCRCCLSILGSPAQGRVMGRTCLGALGCFLCPLRPLPSAPSPWSPHDVVPLVPPHLPPPASVSLPCLVPTSFPVDPSRSNVTSPISQLVSCGLNPAKQCSGGMGGVHGTMCLLGRVSPPHRVAPSCPQMSPKHPIGRYPPSREAAGSHGWRSCHGEAGWMLPLLA